MLYNVHTCIAMFFHISYNPVSTHSINQINCCKLCFTKIILYCTLILPYINYGALIWGNTSKIYLMIIIYFRIMFGIIPNIASLKKNRISEIFVFNFQFASCCLRPPSEDDASRPRQPRSHRR